METTYQLTKHHKVSRVLSRQIQTLVDICNKQDHLSYEYEDVDEFTRPGESNTFTLHKAQESSAESAHKQLVGALLIFSPEQHEAEISLFVHPDYRRRGFAEQLLKAAEEELRQRKTPSILYVCQHESQAGRITAEKRGAVYEFSEYAMLFDPAQIEFSRNPPAPPDNALSIRRSRASDHKTLTAVNISAFGDLNGEAEQMISRMFTSKQREMYTLLYQEEIIGMIGVYLDDAELSAKRRDPLKNRYYIHGFCIAENFQGRGFGRYALSYITHRYYFKAEEAQEPIVALDVQTSNKGALQLYHSCGFTTKAQFDYYRAPVA